MRWQPAYHCQWGGLEVDRPAGLLHFRLRGGWLRRLSPLSRSLSGVSYLELRQVHATVNLHQSVSGTTTTTMFPKLLTCSTYNIFADNPPGVPAHHLYV